MEAEVNVLKYIKLQANTGLSDVTVVIYDSSFNPVFSGIMSEAVAGIYVSSYTFLNKGNYTIVIESLFAGTRTSIDLDVKDSVANAVWGQNLSSYTISGSAGKELRLKMDKKNYIPTFI